MTSQTQAEAQANLRQPRRAHLALLSCNTAWDHSFMTDEAKAGETEALAELDKLTATYTRAERNYNKARDALHEAIVRHLMERNAPPGRVAEHSPYDRNHVGRIAKAAGVPPLRQRTVRSARSSAADNTPGGAA